MWHFLHAISPLEAYSTTSIMVFCNAGKASQCGVLVWCRIEQKNRSRFRSPRKKSFVFQQLSNFLRKQRFQIHLWKKVMSIHSLWHKVPAQPTVLQHSSCGTVELLLRSIKHHSDSILATLSQGHLCYIGDCESSCLFQMCYICNLWVFRPFILSCYLLVLSTQQTYEDSHLPTLRGQAVWQLLLYVCHHLTC